MTGKQGCWLSSRQTWTVKHASTQKPLLKWEIRTFHWSSQRQKPLWELRLGFRVGVRILFVCVWVCVCLPAVGRGPGASQIIPLTSIRTDSRGKTAKTLRHWEAIRGSVLSLQRRSNSSSSHLLPLIQPPWSSPPSFHFSGFHLRLQTAGCGIPLNVLWWVVTHYRSPHSNTKTLFCSEKVKKKSCLEGNFNHFHAQTNSSIIEMRQ